jgi:hypothetical protein
MTYNCCPLVSRTTGTIPEPALAVCTLRLGCLAGDIFPLDTGYTLRLKWSSWLDGAPLPYFTMYAQISVAKLALANKPLIRLHTVLVATVSAMIPAPLVSPGLHATRKFYA